MSGVWLFVLGMGASGCGPDNNLNIIDNNNDPDAAPLIVVDPQDLDFGAFRKGEGSTETVTVKNLGTAALDISSIVIQGDPAFDVLSVGSAQTLEAGDEIQFDVVFTAQSVEHEGRIIINSNDATSPTSLVPMRGAGLIPALVVSPDPFDFGLVEPNCEVSVDVSLSNIGLDTLEIYSLVPIGEGYTLAEEDSERLPLTVEPGDFETVKLSFLPTDYLEYDGELWVDSNAQDPVALQTGIGADGSEYVEEYEQPIAGRADILFWIDQSCSMDDDKERLVAEFDDFVAELEELDNDYLIAVTTSDSGCHAIDYIDRETTNKSSIFTQAVTQSPGGLFTEAGLTVVKHGLQKVAPGECNGEFLRDNTTLSVVMISDEPEQSPPAIPKDQIIAEILTAAPSTYLNAVAGPVPNGCATADPGYGYYEAAAATGGAFLEICSFDWGEKLVALAERANTIKLADTFYLRYEGVEEASLVVIVDGAIVSEGWSYDSDYNAVVFDSDAIPGEGAEIRIEYSTARTCEA